MGIYDRDYTRQGFQYRHPGMPHMRFGFPRMTKIVKTLLIANIVVFFVQRLFFPANIPVEILGYIRPIDFLQKWFSVYPDTFGSVLQLWRLISYQFLHADLSHIFFNMLALFFLGPTLERHWGEKKFLNFYLGCGIAGGIFYTLLVVFNILPPKPMVGASGAILGMLAACAILFPHFIVFLVFFPIPIRVAAVILTLLYVANLLTRGANAGGHAAHLAGMAAGAGYVLAGPLRKKFKFKMQTNTWKKRSEYERNLQFHVDRILKKVHEQGIHSLTSREKRILKQATREKQKNKL